MAQESVITIVVNHVDVENNVQSEPFNKDCVICLDAFKTGDTMDKQAVILSCRHMYHEECIRSVILSQLKTRSRISCPVCRYVFMECNNEKYLLARQEIGMQSNQLHTVEHYTSCYLCIRMFLPLFVFSSIMICVGLIVYFTVPSK
jgi:hypothetical protein